LFSKLKHWIKGTHFDYVAHITSTTAFPITASRMLRSNEEENGEICTSIWDYDEGSKPSIV
jgi:hypothetical protein